MLATRSPGRQPGSRYPDFAFSPALWFIRASTPQGTLAYDPSDLQDLDSLSVERVMGQIRERLRRADRRIPEQLRSTSDIYHADFEPKRRLLGPLLVAVKKGLRRLLAPVLARQVTYNRLNATLVEHLEQRITDLARQLEQDHQTFAALDLDARLRGSDEDLKERQHGYVDCFRRSADVVDLGCGRGVFLGLLHEAGIQARGVEVDGETVRLCREKGLDVVRGDPFTFLASVPDASLGGIFAAEIVERLTREQVVGLVRLCHCKLRPGAPLLLETLNPSCLGIFTDGLTLDLAPVRPIHSAAMKHLLESSGFTDCEIRLSSPWPEPARVPPLTGADPALEPLNRAIERLNDILYGHRYYAALGRAGRS